MPVDGIKIGEAVQVYQLVGNGWEVFQVHPGENGWVSGQVYPSENGLRGQ